MSETATLNVDGKTIELPVTRGSEGEVAIDIGKLRAQTGVITMDPGFANTGSCFSDITFIDGGQGILRYRGYPIEELAEHSNFLEVAQLLIEGELPSKESARKFQEGVTRHTLIHEDMRRFFDAFPPHAHPMAIISAVVSGLSTFYSDQFDPQNTEAMNLVIHRLLAKLPTIASFAYRKSLGLPVMYPDNSLSYCANFLRMMFAYPTEPYEIDEEIVRTMDVLFILHADHEQNCSTSTVRVVGSAHADLFASISAGISALSGPLHGGANSAVLRMLQQIQDSGGNVKDFVTKVKDKSSGIRLMGFGHRVYKNFDPRAKIIKGYCDRILNKLGIHDPLLDIAKELEEAALNDPYFQERKLYPNVDFYSGIIYKALGFPTNMYTVLFSIGRLPGWIAQWKEMHEHKVRIGRPRQIYTGSTERKYASIDKR